MGLPVVYKDVNGEIGYKVDLLVENKVIIKIKSVDALNNISPVKRLTYLCSSGLKLDVLINFNVSILRKRNQARGKSSLIFFANSAPSCFTLRLLFNFKGKPLC